MKLSIPNKTKLASYVLFVFSAVVLGFSIYFTTNIHVLDNWTLEAPAGPLHAGDAVVLISKYTKLKDVDGTAKRYIECRNDNNVFIRYQLNEALADRAAGAAGTGIPVKIPSNIPNLPTTCRFSISIEYHVLPFKPTPEKNQTKEFHLLPPVVASTPPLTAIRQSSAQTGAPVSVQGYPSSVNSTPSLQSAQQETSLVVNQPNILQRTFSPITTFINNLTN